MQLLKCGQTPRDVPKHKYNLLGSHVYLAHIS